MEVIFAFLRLSVKQLFSVDLYLRLVKVSNINLFSFNIWTGISLPTALLFFHNFSDIICRNWLKRETRNTITFYFNVCDAGGDCFITFDNILITIIAQSMLHIRMIFPMIQTKVANNGPKMIIKRV